jgi:hypothetical protein
MMHSGCGAHGSVVLFFFFVGNFVVCVQQGKRDPAGSVGGASAAHAATHQHQGNQVAHVEGLDFLAANEAAAQAWDALPEFYRRARRGVLKPAELDVIELGGAPNYEPKKKKTAA